MTELALLVVVFVFGSEEGLIKTGEKLGMLDARGVEQTPARSLGDYTGRAVLYEFFAYW